MTTKCPTKKMLERSRKRALKGRGSLAKLIRQTKECKRRHIEKKSKQR